VVAIVVGDDAAEVGTVVADLGERGIRAAAFVGDPTAEQQALVEMVSELFGRRGGTDGETPG
jgi:hypothetical protein